MRIAVFGADQVDTAFGRPALEPDHDLVYWGSDWLVEPALEALAEGEPHPDLKTALQKPVETTAEYTSQLYLDRLRLSSQKLFSTVLLQVFGSPQLDVG